MTFTYHVVENAEAYQAELLANQSAFQIVVGSTSKKYASLSDVMTEINSDLTKYNNATIQLIDDIDITRQNIIVTCPTHDFALTLDLNGHTIACTATSQVLLYVKGLTLTLMDSSVGKTGKITNTTVSNQYMFYLIADSETDFTKVIWEDVTLVGKYTNVVGVNKYSTFIMNSGKITNTKGFGGSIFYTLDSTAQVIVNGGDIDGSAFGTYLYYQNSRYKNVKMQGGTFTANDIMSTNEIKICIPQGYTYSKSGSKWTFFAK